MKSHGGKRTLEEERAGIDILLNYVRVDVKEGKVFWTRDVGYKIKAGTEAGCTSRGYWHIQFQGKPYIRSRIIYYVATGELPLMVDHREGVEKGDGIDNLRASTATENTRNCSRYSNNRTGYKGVGAKGGRYRARIVIDKKSKFIGYFDCPIEAAKAYDAEATKVFGSFAKLNFPGEINEQRQANL